MASAAPEPRRRLRDIRWNAGEARILDAALDLFADHGVSGTSLQMIADSIGVAKAAVYYRFKTKDEIVLAVAEREFAKLEQAVEDAEARGSGKDAREHLLTDVIDMAVDRRRWVRALQNDPHMVRLLGEHRPLVDVAERLYLLLLGEQPSIDARAAAAILSAAIGAAVVHPLLADLDTETLRATLLHAARRLFDIPGGRRRRP